MKSPNNFFYICNKNQSAADLLARWAAWQGRNPAKPNYSRVRYLAGGGGGDFSDDEGLLIDRFMGEVKALYYPLYRVLRMSYLERKSNRTIALILDCSHSTVGDMLQRGEGKIEERLAAWRDGYRDEKSCTIPPNGLGLPGRR